MTTERVYSIFARKKVNASECLSQTESISQSGEATKADCLNEMAFQAQRCSICMLLTCSFTMTHASLISYSSSRTWRAHVAPFPFQDAVSPLPTSLHPIPRSQRPGHTLSKWRAAQLEITTVCARYQCSIYSSRRNRPLSAHGQAS